MKSIHTHTYTYTHLHTYIHTYTYTNTHTHTLYNLRSVFYTLEMNNLTIKKL